MKLVDTQTPFEQVIAVPKISNFTRSVLRSPQLAEQLVEVPTVVSFALLQQHTAERIIDIPVLGRGGGGGWEGFQGFSSRQNSTARPVEQNVEIQVPRHRRHQGGLHGFLPGQGVLQRSVEQIAEIPVLPVEVRTSLILVLQAPAVSRG